MRPIRPLSLCASLVVSLSLVPAAAGAEPKPVPPLRASDQPNPVRYLTEPAPGTPREIALAYLERNAADLGLTAGDLADVVVKDEYLSRHNGVTHLYLRQRLDGIEVANGDINVNVDAAGRIVNLGNRFVGDLAAAVNGRSPGLTPEEAVETAARHLGIEVSDALVLLSAPGGPALEVLFAGGELSLDHVPVKLVYYPTRDGGARLAWDLVLRLRDVVGWWHVWVDAATGEVLDKASWVAWDSYNVFAIPKESPSDGDRTVEVDPADSVASPFGWHDTNGVPGGEFNDTQGNNTSAQDDVDANNVGGMRPNGGFSHDFDFPLDLATQQPEDYLPAAIVNLFYWNNILHDVLYRYGFDEASGNFQVNNYGNGGIGGDPVQADAQDGSGLNNANFSTPPDGSDPRMQMFIWLPAATEAVTVHSPPSIAGEFAAGPAAFGPPLDETGVTADLALVNDGSGDPTLGCNPLVGFPPGRLAVFDRGTCTFVTKVRNAQNAGAVGAIVINNAGDDVITMGDDGTGGDIVIPSAFLGQTNGETIKGELDGGVNATIHHVGGDVLNRDSDLDDGVIAHEYGHGLSNRLTGGPSNTSCLFHDEQAGEGWSDLMTLFFTAVPGDSGEVPRGIGTYLLFQPSDGDGIRNFPYTTDLALNPQTYADVGDTNIPHGVGEIWAAMVWEMYWKLVERDGFDPDLYAGTGGNNVAFQLVVDGLKLQPCLPSFVDARDGILAADLANSGGANQCLIWESFAKRGLGLSADAGSAFTVGDEVEAFDVPAECAGIPCGDVQRLQARCRAVAQGNRIQVRVTLTDASHDGETVTLEVDGVPQEVAIVGQRATFLQNGAASGAHTVSLADPAGCFADVVVNCP